MGGTLNLKEFVEHWEDMIRFGAEEQWYAFRDAQMLKFARNWCEENQVSCDLEVTR